MRNGEVTLARWGILRREPRASRGWGQGWFRATYSLAPTARVKGGDE
jgi:hypothetical protein